MYSMKSYGLDLCRSQPDTAHNVMKCTWRQKKKKILFKVDDTLDLLKYICNFLQYICVQTTFSKLRSYGNLRGAFFAF